MIYFDFSACQVNLPIEYFPDVKRLKNKNKPLPVVDLVAILFKLLDNVGIRTLILASYVRLARSSQQALALSCIRACMYLQWVGLDSK